MEKLISQLLHSTNVTGITYDDLHLQLLSHHEYPSLKAVTDTLDYFGVENLAANVPIDALDQLPKNFLAIVKSAGGDELVLVKKRKNKVQVTNAELKKDLQSISQFSDLWNGTIIAIEESKEVSIQTRFYSREKIGFGLIIIIGVFLTFQNQSHWEQILYILLGYLGLYISFLITKESLGIKDGFTSKVCNTVSTEKQGCSAVIKSTKSIIIKNFTLGDACIIYFGSLSLITSTIGINNSFLFLVSLLSIPVTAYALYTQGVLLKQWCALCLVISGILIAQFVMLTISFEEFIFSKVYMIKAAFTIVLSSVLWITIKKLWEQSLDLKKTKQEFYTFKRNPSFFHFALSEKKIENSKPIPEEHRLIFGNKEASVKIIAITNPFCGYCTEPFKEYMKIISRYDRDVSLEVIFSVAQDPENKATQIPLQVIDLYKEEKRKALSSLESWYTNKDLELWFKEFLEPKMSFSFSEETIATHATWCQKQGINYTPETIINNYIYPKGSYNLSDLILFIEDLKEQQQSIMPTVVNV